MLSVEHTRQRGNHTTEKNTTAQMPASSEVKSEKSAMLSQEHGFDLFATLEKTTDKTENKTMLSLITMRTF